jgi:hypothetical protein
MTRNKMEISIDDIRNMEIETPPPLAVQENIVEDITRLMSEGKSQAEALHLVFGYSKMGNKVS